MVESSGLLNRRRVYSSTGGSNPPLSAKAQVYLTDSKAVRRWVFSRSPAVSPIVQALGCSTKSAKGAEHWGPPRLPTV